MNISKITKSYMYPAHGVRVCHAEIQKAAERGLDLIAIEKDFLFGCGITFRFFFVQNHSIPKRKIVHAYGKLKEQDDPIFQGAKITSILSIKILWFSIGYFYVLKFNGSQST